MRSTARGSSPPRAAARIALAVLSLLAVAFALVQLRRAPRGGRWTWGLIAAGRAIATALDPENQLRGPNAICRNGALATGFVAACAFVVWLLRRDEDLGRAKLLCLRGLGVVGALLGARLAPGVEEFLADWLTKAIELLAWALVLAGECLASRRPPETRMVDGFL